MNSVDLKKILDGHNVWIASSHKNGSRANLSDANLIGANLSGADLRCANLRDADLRCANLRDANLSGASLIGANLRDANLSGASLIGANLSDANLSGASLPEGTFIVMGEKYFISICNGEYVRAGCQNHTIDEWRSYSKREIAEMDGKSALKFYPRLLDIIDFYTGKGSRPEWLSEGDGDDA